MSISSTLINWYLEKKRDLPWRNTKDPYKIWVSEVILQQTRVVQGLGYYHRFISRFPDIASLANADISEVLKIWQGLGYYSRARNMHIGAKFIMDNYNGQIPSDHKKLLKIKGIGRYTAAAIGSFAFKLPLAVVDGNVSRVISRYFGIHEPVNSAKGSKSIFELAEKIIDAENPDLYNQAIMEFGALACTPKKPGCLFCPLQSNCYAYIHGKANILPFKVKPRKARDRFFTYIVLLYHNYICIKKRSENDIWKGLYDFPLLETDKHFEKEELPDNYQWNNIIQKSNYQIINISNSYKHQLSHQIIYAKFLLIKTETKPDLPDEFVFTELKNILHHPVPKLIDNYLKGQEFRNYLN